MAYRQEHPNPQFFRENWQNLNGTWEFAFDFGESGRDRGLPAGEGFDRTIEVPFCPESALSGVGHTDFMPCVWYKRRFTLTKEQAAGCVLLKFGACDYETEVFLDGESVGTHKGGYSSFAFDLTGRAKEGENLLVVCARDNTRSGLQGSGKQSPFYRSSGCHYTRTTGIWQTVYLEFAPKERIFAFRIYPDVENRLVTVTGSVSGTGTLCAEAFYEGKSVGKVSRRVAGAYSFELALSELHLWEVGNGRLYDLVLTYGGDTVKSYFGMRSVAVGDKGFRLNGRTVFMRLVLDQGFYPEGIYTAKDEEELLRDIRLSQDAGFNGARLHEKVFEPLFLYHCDRLGYLVWGEYGNWGLDISRPEALEAFLPEWTEIVERDFNHPSLIGWCPFNETQDDQRRDVLSVVYRMTKTLDPTRPCIDTSGFIHVMTDLYDLHNYRQDPAVFADDLRIGIEQNDWKRYYRGDRQTWRGEPLFMSEYGGTGLALSETQDRKNPWSYGDACRSKEEFYARYKGLTDVLLDCPLMCGFCYTQLYDVEQEQNGLYTYAGRAPKVDMAVIREINSRRAAIEMKIED